MTGSSPGPEAWLIGIDLQHVFADPSSPWAAPRFAEAAAAIERMLPAFRGRTLLTRFTAPDQPARAWTEYYREWPFALVAGDDPLYALVPAFGTLDVPVETRETFGKWDAPLAERIGGADEIVLAGVSTDCCVLSTALAAADAGIRVHVVADACAGATDGDHERALAALALYTPLIRLTTEQAVLADRA